MAFFDGNPVGLVLAGGGGKGAYQAGVFRAFEEKGVEDYITAVSGSSVGALNMLLFAYGQPKMTELIWSEISPKQFLEISPDMIDLKEGLVPRQGILDILNDYVDMEIIRNNEKHLYATVTDFGKKDMAVGKPKYMLLNYKTNNQIRDILLASSALPIIYSPVIIDGHVCRDGGLTDNLPISPLYEEGIRKFIVVGLSPDTVINEEEFPDSDFLLIKPQQPIGDFIDGTLDFTAKGARKRMELGYIDGIKALEKL